MTSDPTKLDGNTETARFAGLRFEDFRRMAEDSSLNIYEKIGFPKEFREGHEERIFSDILTKVETLTKCHKRVLDVGSGCSELPRLIIRHCVEREHELVLLDAREMLDMLPDERCATKIAGRFPDDCYELTSHVKDGFDAIIVYSVLQHVFLEANPFVFVDSLMALLRPNGGLLLGDIPNVSKRHRFLSSDAGVAYHRAYLRTNGLPEVKIDQIEHGRITDAVILGLVERARTAGFDAFVLPQPAELPMANRREDILIRRP
ncbi:class I SAM-dependent methyltransferase [Methylocystis sp. WRRC1]|uniref:class I SAM-dependent methyltransferase n=1 Tax=Methylocystis sp. WRRC1 TaxID=1732014 RepID=UPI001D146E94|nr:class I SAM-dependent methyltransferase [Methylocystis sp. WRRC1]MCC3245037.1 class I SAM-dependent methyltransferase [Methylocystis sp. WRRC1]